MNRKFLSSVATLALCCAAGSALAAVSAQEAARLGKDLTPMGAEKAGNAAGTIPAWDGGITSPAKAGFPDFKTGGHHPDPYAAGKVLYKIDAASAAKYDAVLTEGHKALPLSNLDAKLRVETRANLSKLHQRLQTTFIYVTHDQVEAMTMATRIAVINRGLLQQIDTPQQLYDHPNNIFVAGFIGSPAMNFFKVKVERADGKLVINGDTFRVEVPPQYIAPYSKHIDTSVIMGIRPEDIKDAQYCPPGIFAQPVECKVDLTELMGNEIVLNVTTGEHNFIARVDPRTSARMGEQFQVVFNMNNMHLFDPETVLAIHKS